VTTTALTLTPAAPLTADIGARTITGMVMPWGAVGFTSLGPCTFARGSIDVPTDPSRVKLLREHDRTNPVGHAVAFRDEPAGLWATFRVPETPAGDLALLEASERLRDGLSVGVDVLAGEHDAQGVLQVSAALLNETSQVALPAYADARATSVAASDPGPDPEPDPTPEPEPEPEPVTTLGETVPTTADAAPAEPLTASGIDLRPAHRLTSGGPGALDLRAVAALVASANRGETSMVELRAALTNVTTTDVAGIVPPAYMSELVGLIDPGRPVINAIRHKPLPAAGMVINTPRWKPKPADELGVESGAVGKQATEKTQIATAPATIELFPTPVETFAGGNDMSIQAIDRSDPSALEALFGALAAHYAWQTDLDVTTKLLAAANAVTVPAGSTIPEVLAALLGGLAPATTPGGGFFLAASWDLLGAFITLTGDDAPAWWSGNIDFSGMSVSANAGGISVVIDRTLPAETVLFGSSVGATYYENPGAPVEIRAVDVSLLGVDVGVYGFSALAIEWPDAFVKATVAAAPLRSAAKAKS
jgi:HK97 family phage prohead protease